MLASQAQPRPTSTPTLWSKINLAPVLSHSSAEYRGTQIFTFLLVVGVFLGLNSFTRDSLSADASSVLIEAKILKLVSSIFVSTGLLGSIFHTFVMLVFGSMVEHVRGTYALLVYIIQICLISELLTLLIFLSLYYFTFDTVYLERPVCGFDAMFGAFIMCIAEISPHSTVIPNFSLLTFQYLPFTLVCSVSALHLIGLVPLTQQCMLCCGTWVGWLILRYIAPNVHNVHNAYEKGNAAEEFELQYLFPPMLRFPVRHLANITYTIFKNVGCCDAPSSSSRAQKERKNAAASLSDNFNDLVLSLHAQQSVADDPVDDDDTDTFASSVIQKQYDTHDVNDADAKQRQEAKQMIEKRLQQIQKEYNQRILTTTTTINSNAQPTMNDDMNK